VKKVGRGLGPIRSAPGGAGPVEDRLIRLPSAARTPAGPAPFSPVPTGLVAVRPQHPGSMPGRPAGEQVTAAPRGRTYVGAAPRVLDRKRSWERRHLRTMVALDLAVGAAAGVLAYEPRFGAALTLPTSTYLLLSILLPFVLVGALGMAKAYDRRFLYVGAQEYDRVIRGGLSLTAAAAIISYALDIPAARSTRSRPLSTSRARTP
jgi:hypothetical protein